MFPSLANAAVSNAEDVAGSLGTHLTAGLNDEQVRRVFASRVVCIFHSATCRTRNGGLVALSMNIHLIIPLLAKLVA